MRGDKLARFLLGLPGAVLGGAVMSATGLVGCCGPAEVDVSYTIDESQYLLLQSRFGDDDLPESACSSLCMDREVPCGTQGEMGGAGGAGGGGAGFGGGTITNGTCSFDLAHTSVDS